MPRRKRESICHTKKTDLSLPKLACVMRSSCRIPPYRWASRPDALLFIVALSLFLAPLARAQAPYPYDPVQDASDNPLRVYHSSGIDTVDLNTGALTVKVPLISYPQRGGILQLGFTLVGSLPGTVYRRFSVPFQGQRQIWEVCGRLGGCGAELPATSSDVTIFSGFPNLTTTVTPGGTGEAWDQSWITEADGSTHLVGWISSSQGRTLDGTGFSVNALTAPYTITDKDGVKTSYASGSDSIVTTDSNGNQMTFSSTSRSITDTVGRVISLNSNANGGWALPGVNGGTETFTFTNPTSTQSVVTLPDNTSYTLQYSVVAMPLLEGQTTAQKTAMLTQVTLPTKGTISWAYSPTPVASPCPGGDLYFPVISRTVNANDGAGPQIWTYSYNLSSSAPGSTTVMDPLGQKTIYTYGLTSCQPYPTQIQKYDNKGSLVQTVTRSYSYVRATGIAQFLNVNETSETTTWPNGQQSQISYTYDRDNGFGFQFSTLVFIDPNGVVYQDPGTAPSGYTGTPWTVTAADYGNGAPGPVLQESNTKYIAFSGPNAPSYLAGNFLAKPYTVQILAGGNHQYGLTTYNYDESNGSPSGTHGNLTSVSRWLNTGAAVETQTIYNNQGVPTKTCDANDMACANPTIYTYDSTGMFPSSIQYPTIGTIQHTDYVAYDTNTGLLTSHTDQNGVITNYSYNDPLARLTLVDSGVGALNFYHDNSASEISAESKTSYHYSSGTEVDVHQDQFTTGDGILSSSTLYDGLGRPARVVGRDGSVVQTAYDGLGRICAVSNPTFNDPGPLSCVVGQNKAATATDGYTYFLYDALGRKIQETEPDGNTQHWLYNGNVVDFYDEDQSHWQRTSDAVGRLTKMLENDPAGSGALTLETDYTYDPLNNLTSVNQKGVSGDTARHRTFVYDSLSRLTNACDPEAIASGSSCTPTSGPWSATYNYDANGNVSNKTDARGIVTHYGYDALNRLITKTYTNDPANTPALSYGYDQTSYVLPFANENHFVGHLTSIQTTLGTTNLVTWNSADYDQRGNLLGYTTCLGPQDAQGCPGVSTVGVYGLNLDGSLYVLESALLVGPYINAQGQVIAYGYDNAGRLNSIASAPVGALALTPIFGGATYYPGGPVKTANLAIDPTTQVPGLTLSRTRDNRGRITGETDTNSQQQIVYNYSVNYDGNGNVTGYNDSAAGTSTVNNDALHRLLNMSGTVGGVAYAAQETYDHFGNRNVETVTVGSDQMQPSNYLHFSAGNNRADEGIYDNAGNSFSDGANNYLYDAENRICAVQQIATGGGGSIIGYLYAPDGTRLGKNVNLTSFSCDMTKNGMLTSNGPVLTNIYTVGPQGEQLEETDGNYNLIHLNVYWEGKVLGSYSGAPFAQTNWHFALHDWVGTKRVVTNSDGSYSTSFLDGPFGDFQTQSGNGSDPSEHHFTGKERDIESGLDYFPARYYNSYVGRWMSPDIIGGDLSNPQSLNRYAYALNNPLSLTDFFGLCTGATAFDPRGNPVGASDDCAPDLNAAAAALANATGNSIPDLGRSNSPTVLPDLSGGGGTLADLTSGAGSVLSSMAGGGGGAAQGALDMAGMVPGPIGIGANLASAGISASNGHYGAAALSLAFAAPFVGQFGEDAFEGFQSFRAFKRIAGPAGDFMDWHHIVGQTSSNIERFGPDAIHNASNLVAVPRDLHWQITGHYNSAPFGSGQTVREWLAPQSFDAQRDYGLQILKRYGIIP